MKRLFFFLLVLTFGPTQKTAAQCDCFHQETLRAAGYYGNNDFNCYAYVRATFLGNHYSEWVPPLYNSISSTYSSNVISEANDPGVFEEVCDPEDANVVVYPCGHAAVILSQEGCLIEKVGYGASLRRYGLNYGSCQINSSTKYFKYLGSWYYQGVDITNCGYSVDCSPVVPDCNNQGLWYNTNTVLNTVNFTSNYFNQIWADCNDASSFSWVKIAGNDVYRNTFSGGQGLYFYLNPGQSVTYRLTAFANGSTLFTKDFTFVRSGGWKWMTEQAGDYELLEQRQNEIVNTSDQPMDVQLFSLDGRRLNHFTLMSYDSEILSVQTSGIYLLVLKRGEENIETKKVFISTP